MTDASRSASLVEWFETSKRDLPWRGDRSPYEIWVAEVMLQQTQVKTVETYYENFLERFPTVHDLAEATQDEVLKAWEGMGFYARARRLHKAARTVVDEFDGNVPSEYENLKALSGIGDYTAAAIQAFAFDGDRPVMDSNVKRVIARLEAIGTPLDRSDTKGRIRETLNQLLGESERPGVLSEALMELGALICKPTSPECGRCPVQNDCKAFRQKLTDDLPVTPESGEKPHHEIVVAVIADDGEVLISRRPEDKMLGGLWEFPGGKVEGDESFEQALRREMREELGIGVSVGDKIKTVPHEYSHLSINLHAFYCDIRDGQPESKEGQRWKWVPLAELSNFAFPKANKAILERLTETSSTAEIQS